MKMLSPEHLRGIEKSASDAEEHAVELVTHKAIDEWFDELEMAFAGDTPGAIYRPIIDKARRRAHAALDDRRTPVARVAALNEMMRKPLPL